MHALSVAVAGFSAISLATWWMTGESPALILTVFAAIAAVTTFLSQKISTFLKILIATFATEIVIFGGLYLLGLSPWWPDALKAYKVPDSVAMTVAFFAILVWAVSHIPVVRTVARIADRYFEAEGMTVARIWPLRPFQVAEKRLAMWMLVFQIGRAHV